MSGGNHAADETGEMKMGFNIFKCGHKSEIAPWDRSPDVKIDQLCGGCRRQRIGEVIEFVRYGKPPAQSRNHRDATMEEGISVYEVVKGKPVFVGWHFDITNRPVYKGTGRIVGWGADGEPLVKILTCK